MNRSGSNKGKRMAKKKESSGTIHFRLNKDIKGDLEKAAKEEHRSFAAQCSLILEQWIEARSGKV